NMPPKQACPQARTYAEKALALDETLADAHMALAAHHLFYTWDLTAAEHEIGRALELNPNLAVAHDLRGQLLSAQGHFSEAIAESRQATEIESLFHFHQSDLAIVYYYAGKNDEVLKQCQKALELEPNIIWSHVIAAWTYSQLGRYEKATAELIKTRDLPGGFAPATSELGYVYAISGRRAEAQEMARQLQKRAAREFIDPYYVAIVYLGLGDQEQTFAWLNKAIEDRSLYMAWLNVEPKFKALRSDPQFKALVRRVGLAP
ncbi:MAG TPA: hypothetical protein VLG74_17550, partial [Blastocatellia bacterium]|nr:hypothetical protein [Blastocatellia bacterium]